MKAQATHASEFRRRRRVRGGRHDRSGHSHPIDDNAPGWHHQVFPSVLTTSSPHSPSQCIW
eukprot:12901929-Prorocentrum_lima.AAC.1